MLHEKAHLKKSIRNIKVEIIPCLAIETTETHFVDEKLLKNNIDLHFLIHKMRGLD